MCKVNEYYGDGAKLRLNVMNLLSGLGSRGQVE